MMTFSNQMTMQQSAQAILPQLNATGIELELHAYPNPQ
jgi:hypothetical protein